MDAHRRVGQLQHHLDIGVGHGQLALAVAAE
jgi:hypothetical protein